MYENLSFQVSAGSWVSSRLQEWSSLNVAAYSCQKEIICRCESMTPASGT